MPDHKPHIPSIVDSSQVVASVEPRPMGITTDETRAATSKITEGEPLVDFDGTTNPYIDYQFIDLLLSLQQPRSDGYDEMCFIVMGQIKELLFKGLHFELHNARLLVTDHRIDEALVVLDRAEAYLRYLSDSWNVLPAVEAALNAPSLYDTVIAHLHDRGHPIDEAVLDRDWSEPYESNESVRAAWVAIYGDPSPANPSYRLGEALIRIDEAFSIYRWRHFRSVEKIIGNKPGTGGSAGVGWLRHVADHRFFPELWEARTEL